MQRWTTDWKPKMRQRNKITVGQSASQQSEQTKKLNCFKVKSNVSWSLRTSSSALLTLRRSDQKQDSHSTTLGSWLHAPQPFHTFPGPPPCCLAWRTVTGNGSKPPGHHSSSPEHETMCSGRLLNTLLQIYEKANESFRLGRSYRTANKGSAAPLVTYVSF